MRLCYHPWLREQLAAAPLPIRTVFDRKLHLLVLDLRHPSLRAKKYDVTHRRVFRRPLTAGEAWSFVDAVLASPALGILVPGAALCVEPQGQ
jgi:hypothetical protein